MLVLLVSHKASLQKFLEWILVECLSSGQHLQDLMKWAELEKLDLYA